jgi:hypothetical protein
MLRISSACLLACTLLLNWSASAQSPAADKPNAPAGSSASCSPARYCAESGRQLKPETPMAAPKVNQVFRDPDFGSRMVRVTDESGVGGELAGFSFGSNSSAETNEWGRFNPSLGPNGGYFFYLMTGGGGAVLFSMDAVTMQITPHCGSLRMCRLSKGGTFSYVDPNILYGQFDSNGSIDAYNVATGKQTTIYDFSKCPNLPQDLSGYPGAISNSGDDTRFSGYAGSKAQGGGTQVTFYDRSTDRCYWYDTATGRVGGSGMAAAQLKAGLLAPPAIPKLSSTSGSLHAAFAGSSHSFEFGRRNCHRSAGARQPLQHGSRRIQRLHRHRSRSGDAASLRRSGAESLHAIRCPGEGREPAQGEHCGIQRA